MSYFCNIENPAIGLYKKHVERDKRIFHPHRYDTRLLIPEQHTGILWHIPDTHQSLAALRTRIRQINPEPMPTAAARFDSQLIGAQISQLIIATVLRRLA